MKTVSAMSWRFGESILKNKNQFRWSTKEQNWKCGFRLDLLVEGEVVVELKSVDGLGPIHEAIILTYLRLSGRSIGLLINFNVPVLKDGVRRFMMPKESGKGPFNTEFTEVTEKNARKKD